MCAVAAYVYMGVYLCICVCVCVRLFVCLSTLSGCALNFSYLHTSVLATSLSLFVRV